MHFGTFRAWAFTELYHLTNCTQMISAFLASIFGRNFCWLLIMPHVKSVEGLTKRKAFFTFNDHAKFGPLDLSNCLNGVILTISRRHWTLVSPTEVSTRTSPRYFFILHHASWFQWPTKRFRASSLLLMMQLMRKNIPLPMPFCDAYVLISIMICICLWKFKPMTRSPWGAQLFGTLTRNYRYACNVFKNFMLTILW